MYFCQNESLFCYKHDSHFNISRSFLMPNLKFSNLFWETDAWDLWRHKMISSYCFWVSSWLSPALFNLSDLCSDSIQLSSSSMFSLVVANSIVWFKIKFLSDLLSLSRTFYSKVWYIFSLNSVYSSVPCKKLLRMYFALSMRKQSVVISSSYGRT